MILKKNFPLLILFLNNWLNIMRLHFFLYLTENQNGALLTGMSETGFIEKSNSSFHVIHTTASFFHTNETFTLHDLQDQSKPATKVADESIDEGYGDSSNNSSVSLDILSPSPINSVLLNSATDVLARSRDFCSPMQEQLDVLRSRLKELHDQCETLNQRNSLHSNINNVIPPRDSK